MVIQFGGCFRGTYNTRHVQLKFILCVSPSSRCDKLSHFAIVTVRIPFAEMGDFMYRCHSGEHQDGGMMAHIRVIAAP